ncbi:MAG TPA: inositol oxygenase family protein [Planctomycetota bacterium]|nr:inositol oxygenase family protein [Planctomycetota bacterium]
MSARRTFRDHEADQAAGVRAFYREHNARQTLEFSLAKQAEYLPPRRMRAGLWEVMERLEAVVDESDPDTDLPQTVHAFQTAEALRRADQPDWLILVGLVHDMGKLLCLFGEPQWAVVGDTFPVGCAFSDLIVESAAFAPNPDRTDPRLSTPLGLYEAGCGLAAVHFSWGHDEYIFGVLGRHLPEEAAYILRTHSFYAGHSHGAYTDLLDERDRRLLPGVREFSSFDLYSKAAASPDIATLRPYYEDLAAAYLPDEIDW